MVVNLKLLCASPYLRILDQLNNIDLCRYKKITLTMNEKVILKNV